MSVPDNPLFSTMICSIGILIVGRAVSGVKELKWPSFVMMLPPKRARVVVRMETALDIVSVVQLVFVEDHPDHCPPLLRLHSQNSPLHLHCSHPE